MMMNESFLGIPVELKLILSCMRILTDQNRIKEINALNLTIIDWDKFIKLVDWHGVPSLVYNSYYLNVARNSWSLSETLYK
jgi:hypothetical protein